MMKIRIILSMAIICLFSQSCKKNKFNKLTNIGYGTSFGKCVGYCRNGLSITEAKIEFAKKTNDGKLPEKKCSQIFTIEKFDSLKRLLKSSNIDALDQVIGCPDCADGGAEWISVNLDGKEYRVTFEYGKPPKELEALALKLKALKDGFADCE